MNQEIYEKISTSYQINAYSNNYKLSFCAQQFMKYIIKLRVEMHVNELILSYIPVEHKLL